MALLAGTASVASQPLLHHRRGAACVACRCRKQPVVAAAAAAGQPAADAPQPAGPGPRSSPAPSPPEASAAAAAPDGPDAPISFTQRIANFFKGSKLDRERLAALGFGAFAAYGVISNINAGVLVTIAWLTVVKQSGLTPLAPGMWPKFLAVYAGLWVSSHFLRPLRLSLAIAVAPFFDKALAAISKRTGLPKVAAFGVILACIAAGSIGLLGATLVAFGGFPDGLPLPLPVPAQR